MQQENFLEEKIRQGREYIYRMEILELQKQYMENEEARKLEKNITSSRKTEFRN